MDHSVFHQIPDKCSSDYHVRSGFNCASSIVCLRWWTAPEAFHFLFRSQWLHSWFSLRQFRGFWPAFNPCIQHISIKVTSRCIISSSNIGFLVNYAVLLEKFFTFLISTLPHSFQMVVGPRIHLNWTDTRYVSTQTPVFPATSSTKQNAERNRCPFSVFSAYNKNPQFVSRAFLLVFCANRPDNLYRALEDHILIERKTEGLISISITHRNQGKTDSPEELGFPGNPRSSFRMYHSTWWISGFICVQCKKEDRKASW